MPDGSRKRVSLARLGEERHLQRLFDRMLSVASLRDSSKRQLTFSRAGQIISHIDSELLQDVVSH